MSDHEYTLTVRPNAHLRVAYNTDREGLERAVLAVEYGREGLNGAEQEPEPTNGGIEWRGYEVSFARDGETVVGRGGQPALGTAVEELLGREGNLADDDRVRRSLDTAKGYGSRLRERVGKLRKRGREVDVPTKDLDASETIEVPGPGGANIAVSLAETAAAFECYEDGGDNWRWRLIHDDGDTLAVSPSGYDSREEAEEAIADLKANVLGAEIES